MSANELLQNIIGEWVNYTENRADCSMAVFSEWLNRRHSHTPKSIFLLNELPPSMINEGSIDAILSYHIGLLIRFTKIWSKLAFKNTIFKGFEDYGITNFILTSKNPSKSEVANWSLIERSTAFEIIRRLQKLQLIDQTNDQQDKRVKRVSITEKGKQEVRQAQKQVEALSTLLTGDLSDQQKINLLSLLRDLTNFHTKEYEKDTSDIEKTWFA